jgi:hypothetical protein
MPTRSARRSGGPPRAWQPRRPDTDSSWTGCPASGRSTWSRSSQPAPMPPGWRYLREHEIRVVAVNQPHAHTRRRRGKSDPIDAEMAARLFLAGKANAIPKQTDGEARSSAQQPNRLNDPVKARSAATVQLGEVIVTALQGLRDQLACRKTIRGKATLCRRLRPSTSEPHRLSHAAKFALRSIAQRIADLDQEIAVLSKAQAARFRLGTASDPTTRDLDRPRRPAARHRRAKRRQAPRRTLVRRALRPGPSLLGQDHPPPPQLRRGHRNANEHCT